MQVGGRIYGKGVLHYDTTNNQLIYDHTGTPGGAGHYSTFGRLGSVSAPGEAMKETYGVLTIGAVTSGAVAVGDEVSGAGIPPLTAILADLGNGQWLVNNAVNVTGDITITATPLTVKNNFVTGATQNNEFFEIQPNGAFGFDQNPSSLSYATGTAADALGLSQAAGAIDFDAGRPAPIDQGIHGQRSDRDRPVRATRSVRFLSNERSAIGGGFSDLGRVERRRRLSVHRFDFHHHTGRVELAGDRSDGHVQRARRQRAHSRGAQSSPQRRNDRGRLRRRG